MAASTLLLNVFIITFAYFHGTLAVESREKCFNGICFDDIVRNETPNIIDLANMLCRQQISNIRNKQYHSNLRIKDQKIRKLQQQINNMDIKQRELYKEIKHKDLQIAELQKQNKNHGLMVKEGQLHEMDDEDLAKGSGSGSGSGNGPIDEPNIEIKPSTLPEIKKEVLPNYDEVAMAICGAVPPKRYRSYFMAVPRDCNSKPACNAVCDQALSGFQDMLYSFSGRRLGTRSECRKGLHMYKPNNMVGMLPTPTPFGKPIAILTEKDGCDITYGGPNYCCCEVSE